MSYRDQFLSSGDIHRPFCPETIDNGGPTITGLVSFEKVHRVLVMIIVQSDGVDYQRGIGIKRKTRIIRTTEETQRKSEDVLYRSGTIGIEVEVVDQHDA